MHCVVGTVGSVYMPVWASGTHHDQALPRMEELVFIVSGLGHCSVPPITSFDEPEV